MRVRQWDRPGNGGLTFSDLSFGAAPTGNLYRAISASAARAALARAWDAGLRYFDTAPLYDLGLSETRLNHFLRDKPREAILTRVTALQFPLPPRRRCQSSPMAKAWPRSPAPSSQPAPRSPQRCGPA